jgi:hypothetical protein
MLDAEDIHLADSPALLCPGKWVTAKDKFGRARCGFEIELSGIVATDILTGNPNVWFENDTEVQGPFEEMHRRNKSPERIGGNISTRISANCQYAYSFPLGKHGETYIPYRPLGAAPG